MDPCVLYCLHLSFLPNEFYELLHPELKFQLGLDLRVVGTCEEQRLPEYALQVVGTCEGPEPEYVLQDDFHFQMIRGLVVTAHLLGGYSSPSSASTCAQSTTAALLYNCAL